MSVWPGCEPDQAVETEGLPLPHLPLPGGPGDAGHGVPDTDTQDLNLEKHFLNHIGSRESLNIKINLRRI